MTADDLLERIAESLDTDEIIDRLGLSPERLVRLLADEILDNKSAFYDLEEPEYE